MRLSRTIVVLGLSLAGCSTGEPDQPLASSVHAVDDRLSPDRFRTAAKCPDCDVLTVASLNLPLTKVGAVSAKLRRGNAFLEVTLLDDGTVKSSGDLFASERSAHEGRFGRLTPELHRWLLAAAPADRRWIWVWFDAGAPAERREDLLADASRAAAQAKSAADRAMLATSELRAWAAARSVVLGDASGPLIRLEASAAQIPDILKLKGLVRVGMDAYPGRAEATPWSSSSEWGRTISLASAHRSGLGSGAKVCVKEDTQPDTYARLSVVATANPTGPTSMHARGAAGIIRNTDAIAWPYFSVAPSASVYVANWSGYGGAGGVDAWCASNGTTTLSYSYSVLGGVAGPLAGTDMAHDWLAKNSPYMLVVAAAGAVDTSISLGHYVRNRGFNGLVVGGINDQNTQASADDVHSAADAWGNPTTAHGDYELPHLAAPSTGADGGGAPISGTSAATAMVAGAAALIDGMDASLQGWPEAKRAIILATATDRAGQGLLTSLPAPTDAKIGAGVLNADEAVRLASPAWAADAYGATTVARKGRLARTVTFSSDIGADGYLVARWKAKPTVDGRLRVVLAWDATASCTGAGGSCTGDVGDADLDLHLIKKTDSSWTTAGTFVCGSSTYDSTWEMCDVPVRANEEYLILVRKYSNATPSTYLGVAWQTYSVPSGGACATNTDCLSQTCIAGTCAAEHPCNEENRTQAVNIWWSEPSITGSRAIGSTLGFNVENPRSVPVVYRLTAMAAGVDGRRVRRTLVSTVTLAAGATEQRTLSLSDIPIRSVGTVSDVRIEAEVLDNTGQVTGVLRTGPLYYESNSSATTLTFYDKAGKPAQIDWTNGSDLYWRSQVAGLGAAAMSATGTYWNGSSFVPAIPDGANQVNRGHMVLLKGDGVFSAEALTRPVHPPPLATPSNTWRLCSNWTGHYADAGYVGETYLADKYESLIGAENAYARLVKSDGTEVWTGNLAGGGCTPYMGLEPYTTYTLALFPSVRRVGATLHVSNRSGVAAAPKVETVMLMSFSTLTNSSWGSITIDPWVVDDVTNVVAVMTRLAQMEENGLRTGQAYEAFVGVTSGCRACGSKSGLKLGRDPDGDKVNNANYKFVIGHEIGHVVQDIATGVATDADDDYAHSDAPTPYCRCDHLAASIRKHCIQARMSDRGAQAEGFAQYYGARLFNTFSPTASCSFAYYKERLVPWPPGTIQPIPVFLNCRATTKWMDNTCPAPGPSNLATEHDYMNFYYDIGTADAAHIVTFDALDAIHRRACTGDPTRACVAARDTMHWSALTASALAHYSSNPLDTHYLRFFESGGTYGVNH